MQFPSAINESVVSFILETLTLARNREQRINGGTAGADEFGLVRTGLWSYVLNVNTLRLK